MQRMESAGAPRKGDQRLSAWMWVLAFVVGAAVVIAAAVW